MDFSGIAACRDHKNIVASFDGIAVLKNKECGHAILSAQEYKTVTVAYTTIPKAYEQLTEAQFW